eukprot:6176758-Pleurochrysis_carterae.AAC.1
MCAAAETSMGAARSAATGECCKAGAGCHSVACEPARELPSHGRRCCAVNPRHGAQGIAWQTRLLEGTHSGRTSVLRAREWARTAATHAHPRVAVHALAQVTTRMQCTPAQM